MPTAHTSFVDTAAIPFSLLSKPETLGLLTICQDGMQPLGADVCSEVAPVGRIGGAAAETRLSPPQSAQRNTSVIRKAPDAHLSVMVRLALIGLAPCVAWPRRAA